MVRAEWWFAKTEKNLPLYKRIRLFGKKFVENFRHSFVAFPTGKPRFLVDLSVQNLVTPFCIGVYISSSERAYQEVCIVRIDFSKNSVIAKEIQGNIGYSRELKELEQLTGMPWGNFLIAKLEEQAKRNGFKYVRITIPQRLKWYRSPIVDNMPEYYKFANRLNVIYEDGQNMEYKEYKKRLREQQEKVRKKVRQRLRKLYESIAKSRGYKRQGDYFVKRL